MDSRRQANKEVQFKPFNLEEILKLGSKVCPAVYFSETKTIALGLKLDDTKLAGSQV